MIKVLLIGNGAREHIIGKKIIDSGAELFCLGDKRNPGLVNLASQYIIGNSSDHEKIDKYFKDVDLAIVGPEKPLAEGISNFLEENIGIPVIGPKSEVAKIESSKAFTRDLLFEYKISGNPDYKVCLTKNDISDFIKFKSSVVVKPDGLTGGKGVRVSGEHLHSKEEIFNYAYQTLQKDGKVLLEDKLQGKEFTLQAFTDGKILRLLPIVQDYKRAFDNDQGPNTGSMGSYSCFDHKLPFLSDNVIEQAKLIMKKTIEALYLKSGIFYKGILYGQFMLVGNKPFLIEFNSRFGDPEAINVLELLSSDFVEECFSIIDGNIKNPSFSSQATTCVYMVPEGYPISPLTDQKIEIKCEDNELHYYYASVYEKNGSIFTTGSRAIAFVSKGSTVTESRSKIYQALNNNHIFGPLRFRSDIAKEIQ